MKNLLFFITIFSIISCETQQEELEVEIVTPPSEPEIEEPIDYEEWWHQIDLDTIYSRLKAPNQMITTDMDRWLDVFIRDAKRVADLDLNFAYENTLEVIYATMADEAGGTAFGVCNDTLIKIRIAEDYFDDLVKPFKGQTNERGVFARVIKTIYHEFGHDILNITHTCDKREIMYGTQPPCEGEIYETEFKELPYYNYKNFKVSRDNMFKGINQYYFDCGN